METTETSYDAMTADEARGIKDPGLRKAVLAYLGEKSEDNLAAVVQAESKVELKEKPSWKAFKRVRRNGGWGGILESALGKKVEIYCARSPRIIGRVESIDERFSMATLDCDGDKVAVSFGTIQQVRLKS